MLEILFQTSDRSLALLTKAIADVPDEQLADQPPALPNHPLWVIGHMTIVRFNIANQFNAKIDLPDSYKTLFGRGSTPTNRRADYPATQELLNHLTSAHAALKQAALAATPEKIASPHNIPLLIPSFPTIGHLIAGALIMHEGLHIGQITDWRRAHNLPRLIG